MTTDQRISQDLAVVGRVSRERAIALDTTLRKLGATRERIPVATASLQLLTLSRVYVRRVTRATSGATMLALVLALLGYVSVPRSSMADFGDSAWSELFYSREIWVAGLLLLVALLSYVAAGHSATRRFERAVAAAEDGVALARRMVQRADGWALAGSIAGATAYVVFFGFMYVTLNRWGLVALIEPHEDDPLVATVIARSLALSAGAILASSIGALWVARMRRGSSAFCIAVGAVVGVATVITGFRFDVGPLRVTQLANDAPSFALRTSLMATGTIAVLLFVTGIMLRRRAREEEELGS